MPPRLSVVVSMENGVQWRFMGFYGSPEANNIEASWELLRRLSGLFDLPWLCGGDFNEIIYNSEKIGGLPRNSLPAILNFRLTLDECDLSDLGYRGPTITRNNKRGGRANAQERFDRYVGNSDWRQMIPEASVRYLSFFSSDHRPIELSLIDEF